jgi:hypothetical protein
MVARDANHPSIVVWGLFNEEWGLDWRVSNDPERQQVVRDTVSLLRELDRSRPVIDNSGWSHVETDLVDWHYYETDLNAWAENVRALVYDESPSVPVPLRLSATGLKPLAISPDVINGRPNLNSEYGEGMTSVERAWHLKWQTQELRRHDRLSGYVYTELYDIEHEFAGIYRFDRGRKDLANIEPCHVNADTVIIFDLLPRQPGIDIETGDGRIAFPVRISHHGDRPLHGTLRILWGAHLGLLPRAGRALGSAAGIEVEVEPFVISPPVPIRATLPAGWRAGRLHLWLEREGTTLAVTSLDVAGPGLTEP